MQPIVVGTGNQICKDFDFTWPVSWGWFVDSFWHIRFFQTLTSSRCSQRRTTTRCFLSFYTLPLEMGCSSDTTEVFTTYFRVGWMSARAVRHETQHSTCEAVCVKTSVASTLCSLLFACWLLLRLIARRLSHCMRAVHVGRFLSVPLLGLEMLGEDTTALRAVYCLFVVYFFMCLFLVAWSVYFYVLAFAQVWIPGEHRREICTFSSVWGGLGIRSCFPDGRWVVNWVRHLWFDVAHVRDQSPLPIPLRG